MKKYVALLVLFMVLGSSVCSSASEENLPVKGTKQLMFGFSGWNLNDYRGGIGFRYYLREKTVLRFGLDVGWRRNDNEDWSVRTYEGEDPDAKTGTLLSSSTSIGLGAVLERHFRSSWNVVPYIGLGMFGWYDKSKTDEVDYHSDYTNYHWREGKGYSIEGLLLGGLQWHFAPNMSLGGEYRMSLKYSHSEYETAYEDYGYSRTTSETRKSYNLKVDASRLWLSIAF